MVSRPEKAETSMNRVERGRWKLVIRASTARIGTPGVMKISVGPEKARRRPLASAALSRSRSAVVPTATIRPPAARTALRRSAVSASRCPISACMR